MTNAEYLEIFKSGQLIRSPVVRLLEEQIRVLIRLSKTFEELKEIKFSYYCARKAEETKWEAIFIAEYEQKHGEIKLTGGN